MKHRPLMKRIIAEYGDMIKVAAKGAIGNAERADDVIAEIQFSVFMALRNLGAWTPSRSFVAAIVKNKIGDILWQRELRAQDAGDLRERLSDLVFDRAVALANLHTLTPAEIHVFRLVGLGLTNAEVAQELFISPLTIRTHVKRLHSKLDVKGRARLALLAYQVCHYDEFGFASSQPSSQEGDTFQLGGALTCAKSS